MSLGGYFLSLNPLNPVLFQVDHEHFKPAKQFSSFVSRNVRPKSDSTTSNWTTRTLFLRTPAATHRRANEESIGSKSLAEKVYETLPGL